VPFIGPAARGLRGLGAPGGWRALGTAFGDDAARLFGVGATGIDDWASGLNRLQGTGFGAKAVDFTTGLLTGQNMAHWADPAVMTGGWNIVEGTAGVWATQLGIAGWIKDTAGGAFPGSFDPDLGAALGAQVKDALAQLKGQDAFAYALPAESSPTWVLGSASLVGLRRRSTPQWTLDDIVEDAVRNRGGVPIGEGHRMVRWTERRPTRVDGVDAVSFLIHYLIPIPGTRRTQAVQWTATVAHGADLAPDDPVLLAWLALFDNHISSFTWSVS